MKIDIYNHVMPPKYLDLVKEHAPDPGLVKRMTGIRMLWDIPARVEMLGDFPEVQQVLAAGQDVTQELLVLRVLRAHDPVVEQLREPDGAERRDGPDDRAHQDQVPVALKPEAPAECLQQIVEIELTHQSHPAVMCERHGMEARRASLILCSDCAGATACICSGMNR